MRRALGQGCQGPITIGANGERRAFTMPPPVLFVCTGHSDSPLISRGLGRPTSLIYIDEHLAHDASNANYTYEYTRCCPHPWGAFPSIISLDDLPMTGVLGLTLLLLPSLIHYCSRGGVGVRACTSDRAKRRAFPILCGTRQCARRSLFNPIFCSRCFRRNFIAAEEFKAVWLSQVRLYVLYREWWGAQKILISREIERDDCITNRFLPLGLESRELFFRPSREENEFFASKVTFAKAAHAIDAYLHVFAIRFSRRSFVDGSVVYCLPLILIHTALLYRRSVEEHRQRGQSNKQRLAPG